MSVERPDEAMDEEVVAGSPDDSRAEETPDAVAEAEAKADENWQRYLRR